MRRVWLLGRVLSWRHPWRFVHLISVVPRTNFDHRARIISCTNQGSFPWREDLECLGIPAPGCFPYVFSFISLCCSFLCLAYGMTDPRGASSFISLSWHRNRTSVSFQSDDGSWTSWFKELHFALAHSSSSAHVSGYRLIAAHFSLVLSEMYFSCIRWSCRGSNARFVHPPRACCWSNHVDCSSTWSSCSQGASSRCEIFFRWAALRSLYRQTVLYKTDKPSQLVGTRWVLLQWSWAQPVVSAEIGFRYYMSVVARHLLLPTTVLAFAKGLWMRPSLVLDCSISSWTTAAGSCARRCRMQISPVLTSGVEAEAPGKAMGKKALLTF